MSVAEEQLASLKSQVASGFLIAAHIVERSVHHFHIPALEHTYTLSVPDTPGLQAFLGSPEFAAAMMVPVTVGAALLDIVGFSSLADDLQFKLVVRYQSLIRSVLKDHPVRKMISIGDGTIFVFDEASIPQMPAILAEIDHTLAGFNLDFGADDVPQINRRIGVHVGQAYRIRDINGEENYIGTAVNLAQRVSTCVPTGKAGEPPVPFELNSPIYVSAAAAEAFQAAGVPPGVSFHDAGEKPIKGGKTIRVFAMRKQA